MKEKKIKINEWMNEWMIYVIPPPLLSHTERKLPLSPDKRVVKNKILSSTSLGSGMNDAWRNGDWRSNLSSFVRRSGIICPKTSGQETRPGSGWPILLQQVGFRYSRYFCKESQEYHPWKKNLHLIRMKTYIISLKTLFVREICLSSLSM